MAEVITYSVCEWYLRRNSAFTQPWMEMIGLLAADRSQLGRTDVPTRSDTRSIIIANFLIWTNGNDQLEGGQPSR